MIISKENAHITVTPTHRILGNGITVLKYCKEPIRQTSKSFTAVSWDMMLC